jgi:hypothetical protein
MDKFFAKIFPYVIENKVKIIPSAEVGKKSPSIVFSLKYKIEKFPHGPEMVVRGTVPYTDKE